MVDIEYQCNDLECSSYKVASASNLLNCQIACLTNIRCRTVTYDQSNHQCKLFSDTTTVYGELLSRAGVVTMSAIGGRRLSVPLKINRLINGNAETGPCEKGSNSLPPTGWQYNSTVTQSYYNNTIGSMKYTDPGPSDRGLCYFRGHQTDVTSMWQTIDMTNFTSSFLIDNQFIYFNFSAWIGGFEEQNDAAILSLTFRNQSNHIINRNITLGPVTSNDRNNKTSTLFRQATGLAPVGARSCTVTATMTRGGGTYNDGYVDNIALVFYV